MKITRISDSNQGLLIKGVLVFGGAYLLNNIISNASENNANDNSFAKENNRLANELYNAGNTGIWGVTEDEERIIEIAKSIKDFPGVSQAYRTMFGEDLNKDLNKWLNPSELARFNANLGIGGGSGGTGGGTGSGGGTPTPTTNPKGFKKGDFLYSQGAKNLRSTDPPYSAKAKTKGGEKWQLMNNPYYATIDGNTGWWVVVKGLAGTNTSIMGKYYVFWINYLYKK
ncbi:hypothetical protein [Emticicia sp. W12TSBA100-4]|uniref:hypothetical protein n=1 Tax=Emticicia sp. W12TSBA100-4 TaxID=3160965 RepID=UPI0033063EA5